MLKVGMKVVCVKAGRNPFWEEINGTTDAKVGSIYTVRHVFVDSILVEEIVNPLHESGEEFQFFASRFRPLIERKTDISFAHEILRKVTKQDRVRA